MSRFGLLTAGLFLLGAVACASVILPPTHVQILHVTSADRALREEGENFDVNHWELESPPQGLERGFFVVKNDLEWHDRWPSLDTTKVPLLPPDFSFGKEMLIVAAPTDRDAVSTEIHTVVQNESGLHVYVTETVPGTDCPLPDKPDKPNYDIARVPYSARDAFVHLDVVPGDACGSAPEAKITCRDDKAGTPFVDKLSVAPGTKVTCIAGSFKSSHPIIDLTWTFTELPLGSTAKMLVGSRGTSVTFTPDVFGEYGLQVEVLDDLQRRGTNADIVDVKPTDPLVVQMFWTHFDPNDDPSTFPRIQLEALELQPDGSMAGAQKTQKTPIATRWSPPAPPKTPAAGAPATAKAQPKKPLPGEPGAPPITWKLGSGCNVDSPAPYCKAKPGSFTTVMTLNPAAAPLYAIGVHYTDERVNGQPIVCVRAYRGGKLTADLCDPLARKEDSWWQAGVIDADTGKTPQTLVAERAAAEAKAAADAAKAAAAEAKAAADAAAQKAAAAAAIKAANLKQGAAPAASGSAAPSSAPPPSSSARPASSAAPPAPAASASPAHPPTK